MYIGKMTFSQKQKFLDKAKDFLIGNIFKS